ncbi:hypothetical protein STIAU_7213 [Stigmatella aurantiaca DW4/3-1]|uniref:Uncharacterized protein n=1 Tax=Stigmatella aurantiaca (strain DW4/3-1) TaxID=378806 RepID=Q08SR6_STIAD|nr:hypothetical protein STIAU_7213 [Stigmatella aurantiaca DW4/3-1]
MLLATLLVASAAAAQPLLPARQRQDRRAALPTTVAFNGPLDRDSLVLDRTRFK